MTRRRAVRPRRRALVWLCAAVFLAGIAAVLAGRAAGERSFGDAVLVAQVDIPAGVVLDGVGPAKVALVPVPDGLVLAGLVRDPTALAGRRTAVPISAGEPVTEAALGGARGTGPRPLSSGERAVAVPTSLAGLAAGALRPGVHVDAVASTGEGLAGQSAVVVEDAEVLATSGDPDAPEGAPGVSALLRVTPAEALRLSEALDFAREVRLVIRPFEGSIP